MKVVQIKVYRGLKLSFNQDGSPQNENQLVTLNEGREWDKFMTNIKTMGYCKVELVSVKQKAVKTGYKDASGKEFDKFNVLLNEAFSGKEPEKVVTVTDLSKRLDELAEGNSVKDEVIDGLNKKLEESASIEEGLKEVVAKNEELKARIGEIDSEAKKNSEEAERSNSKLIAQMEKLQKENEKLKAKK